MVEGMQSCIDCKTNKSQAKHVIRAFRLALAASLL